jgi:cysteinyl-tRNA synthetase
VLRLFDTASAAVRPLELRRPGELSMYVCGPTVSGEPHLGHGRFTLVWDVLRRYLSWTGIDVRFVSNVTDIEDKIIARAALEGRSTEAVAADYEAVWWQSMERLGVARPSDVPHATDYVEHMVDLVGRLVARGHAYPGGDGVYFACETIGDYGLLARQSLDSLRAGARVEADEGAGKRSPFDFVLWKLARPGEPSWPSPWGPGRPGWHTECVVMSLDLLGDGFDLHGGGMDLAFPHHENERAQAIGAGRSFARRWVHSGMVVAEGGDKMSKSLGNTMSLPELLDVHDPRAYRLLVLQSHYRSPMTVTQQTMAQVAAAVERLDAFGRQFASDRGLPAEPGALERFREAMDDDLDTPRALSQVFDLLRSARAAHGEDARTRAAAVFELIEGPFGLNIGGQLSRPVPVVGAADVDAGSLGGSGGPEIPRDVLDKATARDEARRARDWARADALRDELAAEGWVVEDGPQGTTLRR